MKVLAIGDIHTKTWIINKALDMIDDYDAIIFVGDYADDWNKQSMATIETWRLLKLFQVTNPDKVKIVIGNHDYAYLLGFNPHSSGYNPMTQMLLNTPENKALKLWLLSLPIKLSLDNVTYSHAGIADGLIEFENNTSLWNDDSPLWLRPGTRDYQNMPQIFGHTPQETCVEIKKNIWCIDTFSTYRDGTPIGDGTVLEVIDGKKFNKIKLG